MNSLAIVGIWETSTFMTRSYRLLLRRRSGGIGNRHLSRAIGSALGEDDDDWLEKAVKASGSSVVSFNLGILVGVRELAYLTTDYGYRGPSGLRKITDFGRAYNATVHAIENGEVSEADVKAWVSFGGTMAPYPVTPINRAISGANALYNDETDNPLALITGYSDKK